MEKREMYVQLEVSVNMVQRKSHLALLVHLIQTIRAKIAKTVLLVLLENIALEVVVEHQLEIVRLDITVHLSLL
jgi:hypothetical protein